MTTLCKKWTENGYIEERGYEYPILCNDKFSGFNNTRVGTPFEFKRPSFKAGASYVEIGQAEEINGINKRAGTGNYGMVRPSFTRPPINARQLVDFNKLQALDIETAGQKVQLGESTLKALFQVAVPDNLDTKWIEEKQRLTALYRRNGMTDEQIERELEVNKPLGRGQRTITEQRNIGSSNLSMANKLKEIKEEVDNGNAQSRAQQAILTGQLALVLNDTNAIEALTTGQLTNLGQSLARIGVPTQHKRLGLIPRFVDNNFYNANAGMINLLLFSKVREVPNNNQYNYDQIVRNYTANPITGLPAIKLQSAVASVARNPMGQRPVFYFDLERGGVININQLRAAASVLGGYDGSQFDIAYDRQ